MNNIKQVIPDDSIVIEESSFLIRCVLNSNSHFSNGDGLENLITFF